MQISGMVDGPFRLEEDTDISGMVTGNVIVPAGRRLEFSGLITGDLIVENGGYANVRGIIAGHVRNHGGEIQFAGQPGGVTR